jgi:hypothetical protein
MLRLFLKANYEKCFRDFVWFGEIQGQLRYYLIFVALFQVLVHKKTWLIERVAND